MSNEINNRIVAVIRQVLQRDADRITPNAALRDSLGADSLDLVEIAMNLEETFQGDGIGFIGDDEIEAWQTPGDIFESVAKRLRNSAGTA
jgi:acyl carrier protein